MKIFFVSDARLPTEKAHGLAIMKTCEALARAGADIELIVPDRRNAIPEDPFTYYAIKQRFPLRKLFTLDLIRFGYVGFLVQEFTFAVAAARYLRGTDGMIYSRDDHVLWVLALCGYRRFIWESHTGGWNIAARAVARRASALVVISQGLKDVYVERGIAAEKIRVIPSAIDPEDFAHPESKEAARAQLGLSQNRKVAMYIGRLDGWKGSATLLEAAKFLSPDVQVVVIGGEGWQVPALTQEYPTVVFLGFRPYRALAHNQAAADVLVVPNTGKDPISAHFTSPLKVIAHMASGRPLVASDLPSIRELTGDNAALLIPADDPRALASGIERVLSNTALAERLVAQARERAVLYTWNARAERIVALCKGR